MKTLQKLVLTGFVALFGFGLFGPTASAKAIDNNTLKAGNEVVLTKATKIKFVNIKDLKKGGIVVKTVGQKTLPKGTKLYGFYKGTEGVTDCFYNFSNAKISRYAWPSINLTTSNAKILHTYKYKYSYDYTMKKLLHYHY